MTQAFPNVVTKSVVNSRLDIHEKNYFFFVIIRLSNADGDMYLFIEYLSVNKSINRS